MCIAQKTLKSMPSMTTDSNQEDDDMDDSAFTPKSGAASVASSPPILDRSLPSSHEPFVFDNDTASTTSLIPSDPVGTDGANSTCTFDTNARQ
jgi:hypothetical protein